MRDSRARAPAGRETARGAVRRLDQRGGIHPPGVVCNCGRDYLTLTLEESCQRCPSTRRVRVWLRDEYDEEDDPDV